MPMAIAWEERDDERLKGLAPATVAKVRQQAQVGVLGDAFADEAFCRALVRAIGEGKTLAMARGKLHFRPTAIYKHVVRRRRRSRCRSRARARRAATPS